MEFKFQSFQQRSSSSSFLPPNQNLSFFTQQAMRAGLAGPEARPGEYQNGVVRGAMQRELEKERIRAEIIAEEIVRRRILEEEVRREMKMEREMVLRYGSGPGPNQRLPRLLPGLEGGRDRFGFRSFDNVPFQRDPGVGGGGIGSSSGVTLREIKEIKGPEVNKDKVIFLAKPIANSTDFKRKATTAPGGTDVNHAVGLKKRKTKDDWSCALCRITATSERGLNEHLQGKKHLARERGMVTQKTGFGVGPLPKKIIDNTLKPIKVPGFTNTSSFKKNDEKVLGKSALAKTDTPTENTPGTESSLLQKKKKSVEKKRNGETAMRKITTATAKPKKKFKFWCDICQVGAYAVTVMNAHKKGKKHLANLTELNQTGEPAPETKSAQNIVAEIKKEPDVATEEIKKEPDVAAEEIKEETVAEQVESIDEKVENEVPVLVPTTVAEQVEGVEEKVNNDVPVPVLVPASVAERVESVEEKVDNSMPVTMTEDKRIESVDRDV